MKRWISLNVQQLISVRIWCYIQHKTNNNNNGNITFRMIDIGNNHLSIWSELLNAAIKCSVHFFTLMRCCLLLDVWTITKMWKMYTQIAYILMMRSVANWLNEVFFVWVSKKSTAIDQSFVVQNPVDKVFLSLTINANKSNEFTTDNRHICWHMAEVTVAFVARSNFNIPLSSFRLYFLC